MIPSLNRNSLRHLGLMVVLFSASALLSACTAPLPAPDFDFSLSPAAVTLQQGSSQNIQVSVTRKGSFSAPLTLRVEGLPSGISHSEAALPSGASQTNLTLSASESAVLTAGVDLTVWVSGGGKERSRSLRLSVVPKPDLLLELKGSEISLYKGGSNTMAVQISRVGGFDDPVSVSVVGLPAGVSADPLTIPSGSSLGALTLRAQAGAATLSGQPIEVEARGGGLVRTANLNLTVLDAPSFMLELTPSTVVVAPGEGGSLQVSLRRTPGFGSPVSLELLNAPPGVTGSFDPDTVSGDQSILRLSVAGAVPPGAYTLSVRGSGGGQEAIQNLVLIVFGFSLTLSPATLTLQQGEQGSSAVTLMQKGGFGGAATLSISGEIVGSGPDKVAAVFSPNPLPSGTSILTLSVGSAVPAGVYILNLTGVSGSLSDSKILQLTVTQPSLSLDPESATVLGKDPPEPAQISLRATLSGGSGQLRWELAGPGSLSSTTGSSVTYTPPVCFSSAATALVTVSVEGTSARKTATIALNPATRNDLTVNFTGLPTGLSGSVRVQGPGDFDRTLTASQTLRDVPGGTYTFTPKGAVQQGSVADWYYQANPATITLSPCRPATVNLPYQQRPGTGRLWVVDNSTKQLRGYLQGSGTPVELNLNLSGPELMALDPQGNLWIADYLGNQVVMYAAQDLAAGGSPAARLKITGSGIDGPSNVAFDAQGNLWVTDCGSGVRPNAVVKYQASKLTGNYSGEPDLAITTWSGHLNCPSSLTFDATGNLWVASFLSDEILKYTPSQYAASYSGRPALIVHGASTQILRPTNLAFDSLGNLWVSSIQSGMLLRFDKNTLPPDCDPLPACTGGTGTYEAAPSKVVTGLNQPWGLAFDNQGDLWVTEGTPWLGPQALGVSPQSPRALRLQSLVGVRSQSADKRVLKFAAADIEAGGTPTPVAELGGFTAPAGLVLNLPPAGLPFYSRPAP